MLKRKPPIIPLREPLSFHFFSSFRAHQVHRCPSLFPFLLTWNKRRWLKNPISTQCSPFQNSTRRFIPFSFLFYGWPAWMLDEQKKGEMFKEGKPTVCDHFNGGRDRILHLEDHFSYISYSSFSHSWILYNLPSFFYFFFLLQLSLQAQSLVPRLFQATGKTIHQ